MTDTRTIIPTPAPVPDPLSSTFGTTNYAFTVWQAAAAVAMNSVSEELNAALNLSLLGVTSSSTTSLTIGTGSKTLTVGTGLGYAVGMPLKIPSSANVNNYMKGVVTAYNSGTGSLTVNVASVGGSGTFADWAVFFDIPDAAVPKIYIRNITGADTLIASDAGKLITLSGTFTLSASAAATLGDGWYCFTRTDSGTVTFDPNGSETVDGVTSGVLKGSYLLQCNGVSFTTVRLGGKSTMEVLTGGTSWLCPLGVRTAEVEGVGGGGGINPAGAAYSVGSSGGYFRGIVSTVPNTAYSYAIGAGGAATNGAVGGATVWNSVFTGNGGMNSSNGSVVGGTATGASVNLKGSTGVAIASGTTKIGGSNPLGTGAYYDASVGLITAATGYGSGQADVSATAGRPGAIVLRY